MENMDKGLTVQKWVLINRPKKNTKMYVPKLLAQAQKFGDFEKKNCIGRLLSVICTKAKKKA